MKGVYESDYGNAVACYIERGKQVCYDLDMGEYVPKEVVTDKLIRPLEDSDYRD